MEMVDKVWKTRDLSWLAINHLSSFTRTLEKFSNFMQRDTQQKLQASIYPFFFKFSVLQRFTTKNKMKNAWATIWNLHVILCYMQCVVPHLDSGKLKFNKSPIIQEGILDNLRYQILLDRNRCQPEKSTLQFSHGNYPVMPSKFFVQVEQCPRSSLITKLWNSHNVKTYLSLRTDI